MHALYGAFKVHVMPDGALPPYLDGKQAYYGHYIFTTSPNPSSQMSLVAHSEAFKQAYQEAGYTENGQVTHRPRHEVPTDLRLKFSVSGEDISVLGSWDYSTKNQVYARLPPANLLAIMSGCPSRHNYTVLWALLDPEAFDDYRVMVEAIYPNIGKMLEQLQQVAFYKIRCFTSCQHCHKIGSHMHACFANLF